MKKWTKRELLKLPFRGYSEGEKAYDSFWIVPAQTKHESGYMEIAVIGVIDSKPLHICAYPDDLLFPHTPKEYAGISYNFAVRMDCLYPSGVLQLHSNGMYKFKIDGFSSAQVRLVKVEGGA